MANFSIFVPLIYHIPMTCGVLPSFSNKTFYRYGGHFELMRFKGPCARLDILAPYLRALFGPIFFKFSKEKIVMGKKKDLCTVFGCNNDRLFPEKYTVNFSFCPESARKE